MIRCGRGSGPLARIKISDSPGTSHPVRGAVQEGKGNVRTSSRSTLMRRYASLSLSLLLTVALLLIALGCSRTAHAQAKPTDSQVRQIIDRMGDNDFAQREKASADMNDLIRKNLLTPAQLGILRTYGATNGGAGAQPDVEIIQRAKNSLLSW